MKGKVEKWKALPDEEKQKVLDAFKRRIDNLVYSDICKRYEQYQKKLEEITSGNIPCCFFAWLTKKMTSHILSWLYSEVETSQGKNEYSFWRLLLGGNNF